MLLYAVIIQNVEYIKQQLPGFSKLNKMVNYKNKVVIMHRNWKEVVPK